MSHPNGVGGDAATRPGGGSPSSRGAVLLRTVVALAMVLTGSWLVVTSPSGATDDDHGGGRKEEKVTICHRTASHTNPYVKITVDQDLLPAFYDFPAEHWIHLRTTNPIASAFSIV